MNEKLREKILAELEAEIMRTEGNATDKSIELMCNYYNAFSQDISKTVGAINELSAPIIVAALENYANMIRGKFPNCAAVIDFIKQFPGIEISKKQKE